MEVLLYLIILVMCEAVLAGISIQTVSSIRSTPLTSDEDSASETTSLEATTSTSTLSPEDAARLEERLQRSRLHRLFFLRQHVLDSLGWDEPPDIDQETKRRLLHGMGSPVYVTRQKTCYHAACAVPFVDLPDYVNRTLWFDTSSPNIRLYFNMQTNTDPNLAITSAVIKLHLKHRDDCPCANLDEEPTTTRIHIKIYQYRKPIRSLSRLRHNNKRLVDAKMVTWEGARWVTFQVTEAVRRIIMRGRRNGGFEVSVRDSHENILDAKTVIDPTVCSSLNNFDCLETESEVLTLDDLEENHNDNFSPVLEVSSTITSRVDITR